MISEKLAISPRSFNRIQIIRSILEGYQGDIPFHRYLKDVFARNKSYGSKDRKTYRSWCYAWLRLGGSLRHLEFLERICWAYYLVNGPSDHLFIELSSALPEHTFPEGALVFRIEHAKAKHGMNFTDSILPTEKRLSDGINHTQWCESHLDQPEVFIRIRGRHRSKVLDELMSKGLDPQPTLLPNAFAFSENTDLQSSDSFKTGFFEIQDLASQLVCENLPVSPGSTWWDCCSGAGGKSLLIADRFPDVHLVCSDIRGSILENLKTRVARARLDFVSTQTLDASEEVPAGIFFDGVLLDAPCSGSGTWRRNPENLSFFQEPSITTYQTKQLDILKNVSRSLKPGGFLVYITCSVFRMENEDVISRFLETSGFQLDRMDLVSGAPNKSDNMFVTVMRQAKLNP